MRAEIRLVLGLLLSGCAIDLGSKDDPAPATPRAAPALSGCLPLADRVSALSGRLSLVTLPDQSSLVLADSATIDGQESSVGFVDASTGFAETRASCLTQSTALAARPIIDTSALAAGTRARPFASLTTDDAFLYFSADHSDGLASDGVGLARWDATASRFVALTLLWTADRPSYGSAAVLAGDEVYVLGGLSARFLSADVYLARAPVAQISVSSAYEYWQGGGNFGPDPDSAAPLVEGGVSPSLSFDSAHQRWLLLYATPLAQELTVRSGLGITGPWSQPYTLGHCDLPASDPGAFCSEATLWPGLADGGVAFSQEVNSFSRPAQATDADFWTRLVRAPWSSELP